MLRWGLWVIYAFTLVLGRPAIAQTNPSVAFFYGKPVPVALAARGFHGLFLDTVDSYAMVLRADARRAAAVAMAGLIRDISDHHRDAKLLFDEAVLTRLFDLDPAAEISRVRFSADPSPESSASRRLPRAVKGRTPDDCEQGAAGAVAPFADPTRWPMRPSRSSGTPRAGARPSRPRSGASRLTTGKPACSTHIDGSPRRHTHGRRRSSAQL